MPTPEGQSLGCPGGRVSCRRGAKSLLRFLSHLPGWRGGLWGLWAGGGLGAVPRTGDTSEREHRRALLSAEVFWCPGLGRMLRYLARTPGATGDDESSLLLSFSPSTGNISVVKEIVDKLLKGYDVRLRPDFGGTGGRGRAGAGSVPAPWLLTPRAVPPSHICSPSRPCSLLLPFLPPLLLFLLLSLAPLPPASPTSADSCAARAEMFLGVLCHNTDTRLFLCFPPSWTASHPSSISAPMPDILALFPAEG